MALLYNLGISFYYFLVFIVSPFNPKAKLWIKGRKGTWKKLQNELDPQSEYAWFHASSLGEFEQGRPIIEALKKEHSDLKVILTFFSPSGYEIRKNYEGADIICYLPLDTSYNARKFLKLVKPKWTCFIKYEFWYNFIRQSIKSGSELYLVSGIFRPDQLFFKPYGSWYRKLLGYFTHLFVQNNESANLLSSVSIHNCTVSGDSRFDRVVQIAQQSKDIDAAGKFADGAKVMVCGSTWEPDEINLLKYIQKENQELKLIIAPHEIHKAHIEAIIDKIKVPYTLFSKSESADLKACRILIIDNIGMLSSIYKYGQIAYIGGGFGTGIHNTLEAAVYGVPVIFGPNHKKFQEAIGLIDEGGGFAYSDYNELKELLNKFSSDKTTLEKASKASNDYVNKMKGATDSILAFLRDKS